MFSTDMDIMNLKNQLKHYLELRDMSAAKLARLSKVPQQTISEWLAGNRNPTVAQLKKVSDVLETTVDHLCYGNGSDDESRKVTELDALMGDGWVSGTFEIKMRRVKR